MCRYLLKYSGCLLYPRQCEQKFTHLSGNLSANVTLKKTIGLTAIPDSSVLNCYDEIDNHNHFNGSVLFILYHHFLENGYHAFATDDQLTGVVAKRTDSRNLQVCAFKNFTTNTAGILDFMRKKLFTISLILGDLTLTFEVHYYKVNSITTLANKTSGNSYGWCTISKLIVVFLIYYNCGIPSIMQLFLLIKHIFSVNTLRIILIIMIVMIIIIATV